MGFLDKVRNGLKKTKESLIKNIETVVIGYAKIDDDFWKIWRWFFSPAILAYAPPII